MKSLLDLMLAQYTMGRPRKGAWIEIGRRAA